MCSDNEALRSEVLSLLAAIDAEQIASVLIEAHRVGIIHRDVKPGNIMLMRDGRNAAGGLPGRRASGFGCCGRPR